jgi:hypothetical protein
MANLRAALNFMNELMLNRTSDNEEMLHETFQNVQDMKSEMETEIQVHLGQMKQSELDMLLQINDEVDTMI